MRKLTLMMNTTLDAKVAAPDGNLDWFLADDGVERAHLDVLRQVDAMIFGRVAYDELAGFWPTAGTATADDAPGGFTTPERAKEFADLLNSIPKLVVSHEPHDLPWGPASLLGGGRVDDGDAVAELRALKAEDGDSGDLVAFAGAGLATTLLDADLVDEHRLLVHPLVLGQGLPLYDRISGPQHLRLVDTATYDCGVVELRYARA